MTNLGIVHLFTLWSVAGYTGLMCPLDITSVPPLSPSPLQTSEPLGTAPLPFWALGPLGSRPALTPVHTLAWTPPCLFLLIMALSAQPTPLNAHSSALPLATVSYLSRL